MSSSPSLMRVRRFAPFFWTQALGAFNDNVVKNALVMLVTFGIAGLSKSTSDLVVVGAGAVFILPFFLFSAYAGVLAEKFDKARMTRAVKLLEIGIALLAWVGFWLKSVPILMVMLFLMGLHSTLFGPVKYAILPQALKPEELMSGNAWVEAGTFLAILLGTIFGGWLVTQPNGNHWVGAAALFIAVAGYGTSRLIPPGPPPAPDLSIKFAPLKQTADNLRFMRSLPTVFRAVLAVSWFWFYGALFLSQFPALTRDILRGDESVATALLTLFSLGVGLGSFLSEKLSGKRVELGLIPLGAAGMTIFAITLVCNAHAPVSAATLTAAGVFSREYLGFTLSLLAIGISGGLFIVPLYAFVQTRSPESHRSRVIAGLNILNAAFMVVSALMAMALLSAGLTVLQLLLVTAVLNALVAIYIFTVVPEFAMRFVVWIAIGFLYRIRAKGLEKIPEHGAVLLAANHVSFVDALILGGLVRRPVRFVAYHKIYHLPLLHWVFRAANAIPIAPAKEDAKCLEDAFVQIRKGLEEGEILGIFPEGGLTKDGEIQPFKPGVEKILDEVTVPVTAVPVAISGLWESMWSRRDSMLRRARLPRRFRAHIDIDIGDPIPGAEVTAKSLEDIVRSMRTRP